MREIVHPKIPLSENFLLVGKYSFKNHLQEAKSSSTSSFISLKIQSNHPT